MKIFDIFTPETSECFNNIINKLNSWFFIIDKQQNILWANEKFITAINKKPEDLYKKKISSFTFIKESHLDKQLKICLASNKEILEEVDVKFNKKNYTVKLRVIPYKSKKDEQILLVSMQNMIPSLTLSQKMIDDNFFFNTIFNGIRVYSIITTDKNFLIQRFNKGAELLLEYSVEEAEKKLKIQELLPKHSLKQFQELVDVLKVINLVRREVEMKNKKNEPIFVDLTISKVLDANNKHTGYIFLSSDVTEQKKLKVTIEKHTMELAMLYQDTQRANKAKSVFLANMSHELRTPLTAILGFGELLMDEKVGSLSGTQKDFLNDIYSSANHLLNLINDILDLSKIEADRLEIAIEDVCLNDIIDSAKTFILPMAHKKGLQLENEISSERIMIRADVSRLKQVLYNLYSNAAKFTPEKGSILTKAVTEKNMAKISIIDSGIGIKPEDQKLIFEEFLQIENPYSKQYAGTGLGLALVKRFMEMMEGSISVFSEGEGKGSTFTITVPLIN